MFLRPGQIQGGLLLGTNQAEVSSLFFFFGPDPAILRQFRSCVKAKVGLRKRTCLFGQGKALGSSRCRGSASRRERSPRPARDEGSRQRHGARRGETHSLESSLVMEA